MTLDRRTLILGGAAAAAPVGVLAADTADAAGYFHRRADLRLPARRWTRVGSVRSGRDRSTRYGVQLALVGGAGLVRVRFVREYPDGRRDGTGDQTFMAGKVSPYNVTHWHEVSGFPGRMAVLVWVRRPVTTRYVIVKARP